MAKNRTKMLEIRCNDELLKAIELLKKQYPKKSTADIIYQCVARSLRADLHEWNTELQQLADKLQYGTFVK